MRLFRRKKNPDDMMHEVRAMARDLAAQIYKHSLTNPPRTREQIDEAAMGIFGSGTV
jgi:hypothetical protein